MNEGDLQYQYYNDQIAKMEKMVTSLNDFHNQTQALDANHQAQVADLNTIIQALFENPGTFTGSGANALQDVVNKYLQAEHSFTGQVGDTSPRLATATNYCQTTAKNIEGELQQLYKDASTYADELATLSSENFLQREANYIFNSAYMGVEAGDVEAYAQGKCFLPPQTVQLVGVQMEQEKWTWESNMDTLALESLPALPATPTDPTPFEADPGSNLYPTDEQSLDKLTEKLIAGQLRAEGYTVDDAEIEALLKAGYSPDDIKAILRIGSKAVYQYSLTTTLSKAQIKDLAQAAKQAQKTIDDAQRGVVKRVQNYRRTKNSSPTNYHGRLPANLEQEILSHPDCVYVSTGVENKFIFLKGGNIVVTLGSGPFRGQIITSYGPGGPRGDSGINIYGGSYDDPGVPVTGDMIRNGKVLKPKKNPTDPTRYEPPAIPIIDNAGC